jgi:hypothetical protein
VIRHYDKVVEVDIETVRQPFDLPDHRPSVMTERDSIGLNLTKNATPLARADGDEVRAAGRVVESTDSKVLASTHSNKVAGGSRE